MSLAEQEMSNVAKVDRGAITDDVQSALHDVIGRGPGKVHNDIFADQIGVLDRTVKSWRLGDSCPDTPHFILLCKRLGKTFANRVMRHAGLVCDDIEPAEINAPRTAADFADVLAEMTDRLADGTFCHIDELAMAPKLLEAGDKARQQALAIFEKHGIAPKSPSLKSVPHSGDIA